MSLLAALSSARSSLAANSAQTAVVSRNIAGAKDSSYVRKLVNLTTDSSGLAQVNSINRASNAPLFAKSLLAGSLLATDSTLRAGLDSLRELFVELGGIAHLPGLIGNLESSLVALAADPAKPEMAARVFDSARNIVNGVRDAYSSVVDIRRDAEAGVAASVAEMNDLLGQIAQVDEQIVAGRGVSDITPLLDERDRLLSSLAGHVGLSVFEKPNGSINIYTTSGIVMYDTVPREISYQPSVDLSDPAAGGTVSIDGVEATSSASRMRVQDGSLAGRILLRDEAAPKIMRELDEFARLLIVSFAEQDQNGIVPDAPGLFGWSNPDALPGIPAPDGLAGELALSWKADPAQGGSLAAIRDGGLATAAAGNFIYNATGAAGFSTRIREMLDSLSAAQAWQPTLGLGAQGSLKDLASSTLASIEQDRKEVYAAEEQKSVVRDRFEQAVRSATGVSLDDEMARMLDFEHNFQSTAKLLSVIDNLFQELFRAVG